MNKTEPINIHMDDIMVYLGEEMDVLVRVAVEPPGQAEAGTRGSAEMEVHPGQVGTMTQGSAEMKAHPGQAEAGTRGSAEMKARPGRAEMETLATL